MGGRAFEQHDPGAGAGRLQGGTSTGDPEPTTTTSQPSSPPATAEAGRTAGSAAPGASVAREDLEDMRPD